MVRPIYWAFLALLFAAPAADARSLCDATQQRAGQPPASKDKDKSEGRGDRGHQGPPRFWWIDTKLRAELGVSDAQSAAVEKIWQKSLPDIREARAKLEKLEDALAQLTRDDSASEAAVIAQIEQVEHMRAEANKLRTLMIYRMNKLLSPDQRAKVKALYERKDPPKRDLSR